MTNQELHLRAVTLAKEYLSTEGQLLLVLIEMRKRRAFSEYAQSNIFEYCLTSLKLSRSQAYYFKSVAEKSEAVSELNPKSQVRDKIKPIARELAEMRVGIDDDTQKRLKLLQDVLSQKRGNAASLSDTIAWLAEEAEIRHSPEKKAARVSSRKTVKPASPGRHPIPAPVKHAVIRRQGFRCAYRDKENKRCSQRRWLDFHHVTPVLRGGLNVATNLVLLCREHHQARHP